MSIHTSLIPADARPASPMARTLWRLYPGLHSWMHEGQLYHYRLVNPVFSLYSHPISLTSLIPHGMTLTLCNTHGDELVMRAEKHGDRYVFYSIMDGREIGAWVPA
jgi:hypothetical protein